MIIIAGSKLDWSHISFSNPVGTFFFWTLIILFFTAAWANGAEFLVKAIEHFQEQAKNKREDFHSLSPMQQIIYAIRHHSWLFIQMLLTMFLVEVGLASVAIMGIENGKRLLPLLGH
jgi:putative Ca2+/H+ antiporter (TMEM165/GDT1 family)